MKKLILSLVLAAITLPTMAGSFTETLTVEKINKVSNAIATLEAYGINHTIIADNISDKLNLDYSWVSGQAGWIQTFTEALEIGNGQGALIIHKSDDLLWYSSTTDQDDPLYVEHNVSRLYSNLFIYDRTTNVQNWPLNISKSTAAYHSGKESYTNLGTAKYSSITVASTMEAAAEEYYDQQFGGANSYNVNQEGDGILDSLSGEIGAVIVDSAKGLKETIKTIGYQIAAAEVGKSLSASCIGPNGEIYSNGVCATIGSKFLNISSKIKHIVVANRGVELKGSWGNNNGFYVYLEERGGGSQWWSPPVYSVYQKMDADGNRIGAIQSLNQLSNLGGTVSGETDLVGTYEDSLYAISDLANSLIDIDSDDGTGNNQVITRKRVGYNDQVWVRDLDTDTSSWNPLYGDAYKIVYYYPDGTFKSYGGFGTKESILINSGIYGVYDVVKAGSDREITFADIDWSI